MKVVDLINVPLITVRKVKEFVHNPKTAKHMKYANLTFVIRFSFCSDALLTTADVVVYSKSASVEAMLLVFQSKMIYCDAVIPP